jgi:glyoxylase-like metal-dependent hydrolase (beta-lactamase superfamily II)
MSLDLARREFVRLLMGTGASLPFWTRAAAESSTLATTRLSDALFLATGAGGNVVVLNQRDGVLMVNGGTRERSAELLGAVKEQTSGRRVLTLFNTDWHPEHTGSNETLGEGGTRIIAHENTKQYLANEMFIDWEKQTYKPLPRPALPVETFYTTGTMTFGDEHIEYGHLGQAHTDGDIYVFFTGPNVLVAGHMMTPGKYPMPDYVSGGWLGGLVAATKTLLDRANADTRIVPALGPVQTRADLQAQFDMLSALRERMAKMMKQGMSVQDMLAAGITKEFDATWGTPELFVANAYRGMWLHVRELGGIV